MRRWRPFLILAGSLVVLQFSFFALLSPAPAPRPPQGHRWGGALASEKAGAEWAEWLWLQSPGILLMPSSIGFSGSAWLNRTTTEPGVDESTVEPKPMPFLPPPQAVSWTGLLPRPESSLAPSWGIPSAGAPAAASPLPIAAGGRWRLLEGLHGWVLVDGGGVPLAPQAAPARATVIRLAVDGRGEILSPPITWEGSGFPEADEAARRAASGLRVRWAGDGEPPEASWGLVAVEWGLAAGS